MKHAPWEWSALVLLAGILFLPTWMRNGGDHLPIVGPGDAPHYLLMLNSLLNDGDLDLTNDYAAVNNGGGEAGRWFAPPRKLDHQVTYWKGDRAIPWCEAYDCPPERWVTDAEGHVHPQRRPGFTEDLTGVPERSIHPAGLPLLLLPFALPFRGTRYVEAVAVITVSLFGVLALLLFHSLVTVLEPDPRRALAVTALAFLGTPVWHYDRALVTEGPLLLLTLGAYLLVLRGKWPALSGVLIGLGILMKPTFLLMAVPLLWRFSRGPRAVRAIALLGLPCVIAVGATLVLNWRLNGSPWHSPQPFLWGNPILAAPQMIFHPRWGLLPTAPILVIAALGWPRLLREHNGDARLLLFGAALQFGLISCWAIWWGGFPYGSRLLVPVIPFLALGLAGFRTSQRWLQALGIGLGVVSIAFNAVAAVEFFDAHGKHPVELILARVGKRPI